MMDLLIISITLGGAVLLGALSGACAMLLTMVEKKPLE